MSTLVSALPSTPWSGNGITLVTEPVVPQRRERGLVVRSRAVFLPVGLDDLAIGNGRVGRF